MQCKIADYYDGCVIHFYNRTPKGKLLFKSAEDYIYYLTKFKQKLEKYPCEVFSYCLMPNHFHFCLQQTGSLPIYQIFNEVNKSYALHYNAKYKQQGHVFEDRLQSKSIVTNSYLIQLCKYIHYNPVKANIVSQIDDWEYSNYLEFVGKRNGTLYSTKLIEMYPEEFDQYENSVGDYAQYVNESEFDAMMID